MFIKKKKNKETKATEIEVTLTENEKNEVKDAVKDTFTSFLDALKSRKTHKQDNQE